MTGRMVRTFFKADMASRLEQRREKQAAKEANWRRVCQQVDRRDQHRCRACGERCDPHALDLLDRGHRHHLSYRSKGGQDVPSNLLTLCARCHDAEHRHVLRVEAQTPYGADGPVEVYRWTHEAGWYVTRRERGIHQVERD